MSRQLLSATIVFGMCCTFYGCNQWNEPVGGPGADVRDDQDQAPQKEEATFTASLDNESIDVPAGSQAEITLSIDRGDQFDQTVIAEVTPPEGIAVQPQTIEYQAGQEEGTLMVQATEGAKVGQEVAVEIRFKPESGQELTKQLLVTVTEPERGSQQ